MGTCASVPEDPKGQAPEEPIEEAVTVTDSADSAANPIVAQQAEAAEEEGEKVASADESKTKPADSDAGEAEKLENDKNGGDTAEEEEAKEDAKIKENDEPSQISKN